jgi:hypothetical protein
MKSLRVSLALCALILGCNQPKTEEGPSYEGPKQPYQRYSVRQAHIHYVYSGDMRGTEDLYFTDYGKREARHSSYDVLTPQEVKPLRKIQIADGARVYIVDVMAGKAMAKDDKFIDSLLNLKEADPPEVIAEQYLRKGGFENIGTGSILGYPTTRWRQKNTGTILDMWGGVILRREVVQQGAHVIEATQIDTTNPPDPSKFELPPGVVLQDNPMR